MTRQRIMELDPCVCVGVCAYDRLIQCMVWWNIRQLAVRILVGTQDIRHESLELLTCLPHSPIWTYRQRCTACLLALCQPPFPRPQSSPDVPSTILKCDSTNTHWSICYNSFYTMSLHKLRNVLVLTIFYLVNYSFLKTSVYFGVFKQIYNYEMSNFLYFTIGYDIN